MSVLYFIDVFSTSWNASHHLRLEALVHFLLFPEVAVAVLDPFEVRRRDAAGVGEDVGNDEDAALVQLLVGLGRRRAVGALGDDLRLDAPARSPR